MRVVTLPEPPATMSVTVVRRWGEFVMVADPSLEMTVGDFELGAEMVSATDQGVLMEVSPGGQLDDWEKEEDSWEYETVTLHFGIGTSPAVCGTDGDRQVVFDGVIATPTGMVAVTDGVSPQLQLPVWPEQTRLVVATVEGETFEAREVWIDLLPA